MHKKISDTENRKRKAVKEIEKEKLRGQIFRKIDGTRLYRPRVTIPTSKKWLNERRRSSESIYGYRKDHRFVRTTLIALTIGVSDDIDDYKRKVKTRLDLNGAIQPLGPKLLTTKFGKLLSSQVRQNKFKINHFHQTSLVVVLAIIRVP